VAVPRDLPGNLVVAIDGPSGSGKSTVARRVAEALNLAYLDTGAMYRALTLWALQQGVDLADTEQVALKAQTMPLQLDTDPHAPRVVLDGIDVSAAIRDSRISEAVSAVATNLAVRSELARRQRQIIEHGNVVAEGRDITTVVAPDAPVRILLTAAEHARVSRRARDVHGTDDPQAVAATQDQVLRRDATDATVAEFHAPADGVDVIDSSHLTVDETVDAVLALIEQRTGVRPAPVAGGGQPR
jgi:CMP/dCMP kinase